MRRNLWPRKRSKPSNQGPARCPLQLESLEDRTVPSASALGTGSRLPLSFEANHGQADAQVNFLSRGQGYTLFLTPTQAVLDIQSPSHAQVVRVQLAGSNPAARPVGLHRLSGVSNYLIGKDPLQWHTRIPNYSQVEYQNVYPGVNLVYHGNNQQHLEYDFVVAPGARTRAIQLSFLGAQSLTLDGQGDLVLHTARGDLTEQAPILYQAIHGVRQNVSGHYVLEGKGRVGFAVAAYDPTQPLVIDPVYSLAYSTYLGGNGQDVGQALAVDSSGCAYVTGSTESTNFPTQNPFQRKLDGAQDVFVTKLNASGTGLVYSTYLGGSGYDVGLSIAVDGSGTAYLTGYTSSTDFPTRNAFQATFCASHPFYGNVASDAFVTRLNATGSAVLYSTYLGGNGTEDFFNGYVNSGIFGGIAVDGAGNAYVTGLTNSSDFPTTPGAFQSALAGTGNAFVARVNTTLAGSASLVWSTYLGGNGVNGGHGIAVDSTGNVCVTGWTNGTNFPTQTALFSSGSQGFLTKLNAAGSALLWSTYLPGVTASYAVALDNSGDAWVTGSTSGNLPTTAGAFEPVYAGGGSDAFVLGLDPSGSGLVYSSYLGGSGSDQCYAIAVDGTGHVYVTGATGSSSFPVSNAFQPTSGGGMDAFVAQLDPTRSGAASLVYSSYLGGSSLDQGNGIAVDSSANAYITGTTYSTNFPTTNGAFQTRAPSSRSPSAFVTKIEPPAA
jgi:hypothetical protein